MRTIEGKLALITGAAAGIGRALALALADHGTHLLLVDVDEARLAETAVAARRHGVCAAACVADLGNADEVRRVAAWVKDDFGGLDILINNAGVAYYGTTHEMREDQWRKVLAVNLLATVQLTNELLPCLFERPQAHVLNMCSIAGLVGMSRLAVYNASKFALVGFSESLRAEYGPRGLGVTAFCPGLVRTGIFESAMTGGGKSPPRFPAWMTTPPEPVARRAVRAIRKNQGLVVVTAAAHAIWWLKRLFPKFLDRAQQFRRVRRLPPVESDLAGRVSEHWDQFVRRAA
jgi:short-subunit dehydrogenase